MRWETQIRPGLCAPSAVALGYFDGVHLGHRAVLAAARAWAQGHGAATAVFTFTLPPEAGLKGAHILQDEEKRSRLCACGAELVLCPPFEVFCALACEEFVMQVLRGALGAKAVFCGPNFTFGRGRAGDARLLEKLCAAHDIEVHVVPLAAWGGQTVSSTRIRAALAQGDVPAANAMLAQPYAVSLPVRHGRGNGQKWGFPTINQVYPGGLLVPREGVYVSCVTLADGTAHPGATGLGSRPTVNDDARDVTCETFLPGFSGDVYGETARLVLCRYLWPTRKFETVDALRQMVQQAAAAALENWQVHERHRASV